MTDLPSFEWQRRLLGAGACLVAAAAILAAIPAVFGTPRPIVRVTWQGVGAADRMDLERRFGLENPIALGDGAWGYRPADGSPETLRALLRHPAAARVDGIDTRTAPRIARSLPLSPRLGGWIERAPPWVARAARLIGYLLAALGLAFLGLAVLQSRLVPKQSPLGRAHEALRTDPSGFLETVPALIRGGMQRGVPVLPAETVGLFRIVFGGCVLAYVVAERVDLTVLQSPEATAAGGLYGAVVRWLAAHPAVTQHLGQWLVVSGACFVAGVLTPISYACLVAGFLVWTCVLTLSTSAHAVASLAVAMLCLLPARWSDAWSVDALVRRMRGWPRPSAPAQRYGFAVWIPRLVLGITFLAAAWSKVRGGGLDWVMNGTVKYYFVSDLDHALVSWGPALTAFHWVAIVMSGVAVLVEALLITAAFSRSAAYALCLGLAALSLLAGFALFQGVLWWGWWILLTAFLPWQHLRPRVPWRPAAATAAPAFGLAPVQRTAAAVLVLQQVVMSVFHVEARPMLSAYDMYSATYASAEEFEDATNLVYRGVVVENDRSRELTQCVLSDRDAGLLTVATAGEAAARARLRDVLRPCLDDAPAVQALALEGDRRVFDWEERRFEWQRAVDVIGPVPAGWLRE